VIRVLLSVILAAVALRADSLDAVLQRMDEGARKFKSVSANLNNVNYTAVLQESSTQTGMVRLQKRGKGEVVGVMHFNPPDESTVGFKGHIVEKYYPKGNQVNRIDVGKNAAQIDQFILLTFGAAGDLEKSYDVKFAGTETVDGKRCAHLQLTPKSAEARKLATMVEMWVPEDKPYAIQQKVTEPSGNYVLNSYTDVKSPASLPDSAFELKYPANAKVVNLK
jgi:outer membrane lipoprotein-sorting protein